MDKETLQQLMAYCKTFDAILLPCGRAKAVGITTGTVEEIYVGGFFKKQLTLAKKIGLPIFVLSSKYGVLTLDQVIEPYNLVWDGRTASDASRKGKPRPPNLTEEQRQVISREVTTQFTNKKVLSFCSKFYKKHQPDFIYFHDLIEPFARINTGKGMQFINKMLHDLITEAD